MGDAERDGGKKKNKLMFRCRKCLKQLYSKDKKETLCDHVRISTSVVCRKKERRIRHPAFINDFYLLKAASDCQ